MGVYSRYIFRQTATAVTMILVTLIIIIWVSVALKDIKLMTSEGQTFGIFIYMTMLAMPQIIGIVMPIALLIACTHVLNKLSGDSEIIVMAASGAGRWKFAWPLLLLGFIVTLLIFANNAYVQPTAQRELRNYIIKVRTDLISHVLQPGRFTTPIANLTFHIRARADNGDILGFIMHDARGEDQIMSYMADHSKIIKKDGSAFLVMYEGHIHRRSKKNNEVQIIAFDQYIFDLSRFGGNKGKKIDYKTYESYIGELISPDPENHYFKHRPGRFWAELHDRLSNPLYPILFVLVAIAMLGFPRTTREDRMKNVIIALVMASGARLGGLLSVNVLAKNEAAIFLVYGIPVCGILLAVYIIQSRGAGSGLKGRLRKLNKKSSEGATT
ncbi:MAG: LptF/LptG family permease [Hyphomicrobiaceae bacterium]|nr:LptF/LptG family permease [Hyphomicrobiaceae bacterium]